jgi:single-strand DNA-binding protein
MIKLQVIGNLGKDAVQNTVKDHKVINFTLAHTEKYRSGDEPKTKTTWLDCAYWTDKDGLMPYLKKGQQVYVEGTPDVREWTNSEGKSGSSLTVRVSIVQLLGSADKSEAKTETKETEKKSNSNGEAPKKPTKDDLPF